MKRKNILYFQIVPIILFILLIINFILNANNYTLLLFNQSSEALGYLLILLIIIYEMLYLIISYIIIKKFRELLFLLLCIPFFIYFGIGFLLSAESDYQKINIQELDEKLVITNHSFLLSGESTIYQKVNFITGKRITIIDGHHGSKPLSDPEFYEIRVEGNNVLFEYNYKDKQLLLTLEYNGETFIFKGTEVVK